VLKRIFRLAKVRSNRILEGKGASQSVLFIKYRVFKKQLYNGIPNVTV
jgi:hypothetical protein